MYHTELDMFFLARRGNISRITIRDMAVNERCSSSVSGLEFDSPRVHHHLQRLSKE